MKKLLVILLTFTPFLFCYSQDKLDTSWMINNHKYRALLERDENIYDNNTKITFFRDNQLLLSDSIFCSRLYLEFKDMNSDGLSDLLVYQSSGARANETFNLFLFVHQNNSFKKVDGFNDWPNVIPTKENGILSSTILTGNVLYHFFRINDSGELIDLNISEDDQNLDGKEYGKGLRRAKKLQKQSEIGRHKLLQ